MGKMMTAVGFGELYTGTMNLGSLTRGDRIIDRVGRLCEVTNVRLRPGSFTEPAKVWLDSVLVSTGEQGWTCYGVSANIGIDRVEGARSGGGMR